VKEKKSAKELEALIMQEVRKHPDLNNVQGVLVERKLEQDVSNWKPVFVMNGPRNTPQKASTSQSN
jgi:hypothetical protein